MWRFRNLIDFLKRLKFWLPVLWKDRDWGSAYLYYMMAKKIERIRASMIKANRHTTVKRDVRNMTVAIGLLKRIAGNGSRELSPYPYWCEAHIGCEDAGIWTWEERECTECDKTRRRRFKWLNAKEKADETYLWELMSKESEKWWD